jgi:Mor family transcriptional regulator
MLSEPLLADISAADIESEQMQMVAEHCGLPDAVTLMDRVPGLELYIPASAKKGFDWEYVRDNYTGYNAATLAGRLGLNREDVVRLSSAPAPMSDSLSNSHLRIVAARCGIEIAKRLAQNFPGYRIYIPINGLLMARKRYIERTFNGSNTQELALACHVTERFVRKVISEMYKPTAQLSLFEK